VDRLEQFKRSLEDRMDKLDSERIGMVMLGEEWAKNRNYRDFLENITTEIEIFEECNK
jgi:hypothetical protein